MEHLSAKFLACIASLVTLNLFFNMASCGVIHSQENYLQNNNHLIEKECEIPENLATMFRDYQEDQPHDFLYTIPTITEDGEIQLPEQEGNYTMSYSDELAQHMYGDQSPDCVYLHNTIGARVGLPAEQASTCPWFYEIHHDPARFPKDILHARCKCEECGVCQEDGEELICDHLCDVILTDVTVFRRTGCVHGLWQYAPSVEPTPTGCTCSSVIFSY